MCKVGDTIENTNALERVAYRIHVVGNDTEDLAKNLVSISEALQIYSTEGMEMQLEPLTYKRCIQAITER